jgi:hypothetical protein
MTQISRPFQVVLAAFAVFVAVWFLALRAHDSTTGGGAGSSAAVSQSAKPATTKTTTTAKTVTSTQGARKAVTTTTATHTTSTAGDTHVSQSTHAVHGADTSAVTVKRSVSTPAGKATTVHTNSVHHTSTGTTVVHATVVKQAPAKAAPAKPAPAKPAPATPKTTAVAGAPAGQREVEAQLHAGKTVLILFWNPRGADDAAVHGELPAVERKLGGKVAVHYASANQVGEYGTVTHAIQVNQTPTLLIVNSKGQTTVLTGLTDAFAIEQTIHENEK